MNNKVYNMVSTVPVIILNDIMQEAENRIFIACNIQ